jgi:hypothetical protein
LIYKGGAETGDGPNFFEPVLDFVINHPITIEISVQIALKIWDYLIKLKQKNDGGVTRIDGNIVVNHYNKNVYVINPDMSKKEFVTSFSNIEVNNTENTVKTSDGNIVFWNKDKGVWEERKIRN